MEGMPSMATPAAASGGAPAPPSPLRPPPEAPRRLGVWGWRLVVAMGRAIHCMQFSAVALGMQRMGPERRQRGASAALGVCCQSPLWLGMEGPNKACTVRICMDPSTLQRCWPRPMLAAVPLGTPSPMAQATELLRRRQQRGGLTMEVPVMRPAAPLHAPPAHAHAAAAPLRREAADRPRLSSALTTLRATSSAAAAVVLRPSHRFFLALPLLGTRRCALCWSPAPAPAPLPPRSDHCRWRRHHR